MKAGLRFILVFMLGVGVFTKTLAQDYRIIGYYAGPSDRIDSFDVGKLTHLIYCFGGIKASKFHLWRAEDTVTIHKMVGYKKQYPDLKIMLSLGGWGGCGPCSETFSTEEGRTTFARSVREISSYFKTDGIDLDWEYPVIAGYPGHRYHSEDKPNFTALLRALRLECGPGFEISFAAGGFSAYIDSAIDWKAVEPDIDFINIMSYDLVHGNSTRSGHHTPLYSTSEQLESTDHAVNRLLALGMPAHKLIIGAAFYGRYFIADTATKASLYQASRFWHSFSWKHIADSLSAENGYIQYWDAEAQAPYALHQTRPIMATYDNRKSVRLKARYVRNRKLGGMMFWQLVDDQYEDGLLATIFSVLGWRD